MNDQDNFIEEEDQNPQEDVAKIMGDHEIITDKADTVVKSLGLTYYLLPQANHRAIFSPKPSATGDLMPLTAELCWKFRVFRWEDLVNDFWGNKYVSPISLPPKTRVVGCDLRTGHGSDIIELLLSVSYIKL